MTELASSLVTWNEFLELADSAEGFHYELHDGEIVEVPPRRPLHMLVQEQLHHLLRRAEGRAVIEFGYRPQPDMQYWQADLAFIPRAEWNEVMVREDFQPYVPPLIIEVLSPSNRPSKVNRQRIVAMSGGTQEFWVIDAKTQTVQVTTRSGVRQFGIGDSIASDVFGDPPIRVEDIFRVW